MAQIKRMDIAQDLEPSVFGLSEILEAGVIQSELDLERALILERKLRVLAKTNSDYAEMRSRLRDIIAAYEEKKWRSDVCLSDQQIRDSEWALERAERERVFIRRRKEIIRQKLKEFNLTQQELGTLLGHNNKSYISELMNGISPFALKDLIVIHQIFKIELSDLIPTILTQTDFQKIKVNIESLNNDKLSKAFISLL